MGAPAIASASEGRPQLFGRVFDTRSAARRRLLGAVSLSLAGGVVSQGCTLISAVAAARILGKFSYGHLAGVQSAAVSFTNLASLGLGVVATKYVSEYREADPERAGRILGLASMAATAAASLVWLTATVFAARLSAATFGTSSLAPDLRWAAIYIFFTILNGYQAGTLAGLESFSRVARIALAAGLAGLVSTLLLASSLGEQGAALAFGLTAFFVWSFHHWALPRELRRFGIAIRYRGAWQERAALVRFALPATYSGIVGSVAVWWCYGYLIRNRGFSETAIYAAAINFRSVILFVPNLVNRVTGPVLNNLLAAGNSAAYRRVFWRGVTLNAVFAIVAAGFLAAVGRWLLAAFGKDFTASSRLLWIVMGSAVIEVTAGTLYQATFTRPSLGWQVVVISVWSALLVGITRMLVPSIGPEGLAAAYATAFASSAIIYFRVRAAVPAEGNN